MELRIYTCMMLLRLYPAERHDGRQSAYDKQRGLPAARNKEVCVMKVLVARNRCWRQGEAEAGRRVRAAARDVDDGPGRTPA
jgi:hypothetical protein